MAVKCGRGPHYHESIEEVRACYNGTDPAELTMLPASAPVVTVVEDEPEATERQINFLCSLATQKLQTSDAVELQAAARNGRWGRRSISGEIKRLQELPKRPIEKATESPRDGQAPVTLEAGMYRLGETIYKVQVAVHGSGHPYAKRLAQTDECRVCGVEQEYHEPSEDDHGFQAKWKFQYAAGAIRDLRPEHRMSLEEAKEFGAIYGICCVCAAVLTNEESIEAGIGPICGGRV